MRSTHFERKETYRIPFLTGCDAAHAMQLIKNSLQARQNSPIHRYGERPFETRFMLRLAKKALQLYELDLQMKFPISENVSHWSFTPRQRTDIAMNALIELFTLGRSTEVLAVDGGVSASTSPSSSMCSGVNEFDMTNRVYNHPTFKQNLNRTRFAISTTVDGRECDDDNVLAECL